MDESDRLLYWLSARGHVGAAAFRAACVSLVSFEGERAAYRSLQRVGSPLLRLGHIEFLPRRQRWVVVPPVCLWRSGSDGYGELFGARTPGLRAVLTKRLPNAFQIESRSEVPERWLLRAPRSEVETALANLTETRIEMADERGVDLLRCLPPLSGALTYDQVFSPNTRGTHWERCDFQAGPRSHTWRDLGSPPTGQDGLFRERIDRRNSWFHLLNGKKAELNTAELRAVGWWRERVRSGTVCLLWRAGELILPARGLPLPVLLDRPLALASGNLPCLIENGSRLSYSGVEKSRAEETARILGVSLTRE